MSGFITNLVENFVEKQTGSGHNQSTSYSETENYSSNSYNTGPNYNNRGPPQVPYPWRAQWEERSQTYIYVHQETGERVYEYDEVIRRTQSYSGGGGYQQRGGYQQDSSYYSQQSSGYGGGERVYESQQVEERSSGGGRSHGHGMMYGALGAAAGLAVGAGAMYEGEKIHKDWEEDKYRLEEDKYRVEDDVEYAPERVAGWAGERVGDAEYDVDRFDNRVENDYEDVKYGIEDAPENAAGWVGEKVGDVERFDDNVDYAYDQGRDDARYGDDDRW